VNRPWGSSGLGWLFAFVALVLAGGSLLGLWAFSALFGLVCFVLLALACLV
jgi:hypothetical protein